MEREDEAGSEAQLAPGTEIVIKVAGLGKADAGAAEPLLPRGTSNQISQTDPIISGIFNDARALEPPHDPAFLCWLFEHSSAWRQCVDSYATNIHGFGHRLEPVIDLAADDADQKIKDALTDATGQEPTPEDVKTYREQLARDMRREKVRLETFLEYACLDHSFVVLRRRMCQDQEITGNAYWEVIRNGAGEVAELLNVPSHTVRLLPYNGDRVAIRVRIKVSPFEYGEVETKRYLRRYVQVFGASVIYFKSFGDTRPISWKTGQVVPLDEQGKPVFASDDGPATELVHFKTHGSRTADSYGITRYSGNIVTMLGLRESEEVVENYFENKAVPPLLLMIAGADQKSVDETQRSLEEAVTNTIKGKKNFHRVLVVGAAAQNAGSQTSRVTIHAQPLTDAQMKDAIFGNYDIRCMDKNGMTARLPRMLRGDIQDVNRASADASLVFAEAQVFAPERQEFDDWMNRKLFADMGIRFWRFVSNGPMPRDSAAVAELLGKAVTAGLLTVNEARALGADVFNRPLPEIHQDWASQPLPLLLRWPPGAVGETALPSAPGGLPLPPKEPKPPEAPQAPSVPPEVPAAKGAIDVPATVRALVEVRNAMLEEARQHSTAAFDADHPQED